MCMVCGRLTDFLGGSPRHWGRRAAPQIGTAIHLRRLLATQVLVQLHKRLRQLPNRLRTEARGLSLQEQPLAGLLN